MFGLSGSPVVGGSFYESISRPASAAEGLPVSRPARDDTRVTRGIRLHDLRHAFATMQLMAGTRYHQVSHWLGQATFTLTLDTYGDWIPEAEGGVGDALSDPRAARAPRLPPQRRRTVRGWRKWCRYSVRTRVAHPREAMNRSIPKAN